MKNSKWILINWKTFHDIFTCNWRLSRWEYRFYFSINILLFVLWIFISHFIFEASLSYSPQEEPQVLNSLSNVLLIIPILFIIWSFVIWIMRLHDLWWKWLNILLLLIPLVNIWILFKIWFEWSEEWKNDFWLEPKKVNRYINLLSVWFVIISILFFCWSMIYMGLHSIS